MEKNKESIQFTIKEDLMFSLVMQDMDLCKGLIERILPWKKNLRTSVSRIMTAKQLAIRRQYL